MEGLPDVTAVWRRDGDHYDRVTPVRWDRMHGAEKRWFATKAQEFVDTQAAAYGPDLIATLPDDTTYSVLGDHGGIQRSSQQVPIVFAGAGTSHRDLRGGEVGRHHADGPAGAGHRTDGPDGRHRVRAAGAEGRARLATLGPRLHGPPGPARAAVHAMPVQMRQHG